MALAPDIGLLLTCEIDKYIDLVASERVHELDGVLHYRNPNSARARGAMWAKLSVERPKFVSRSEAMAALPKREHLPSLIL